jgi:predicted lysophospholipase L1 biosynthesis ABC-type transport system permease subunit
MSTLFASQSGSLEVAPHNGLHYDDTSALPEAFHARYVVPNERQQTSPEQGKHFLNFTFRKTTFYLTLAFLVALILATVAAAIGGSMAVRRQHHT